VPRTLAQGFVGNSQGMHHERGAGRERIQQNWIGL
jgi:hypothetical protein